MSIMAVFTKNVGQNLHLCIAFSTGLLKLYNFLRIKLCVCLQTVHIKCIIPQCFSGILRISKGDSHPDAFSPS